MKDSELLLAARDRAAAGWCRNRQEDLDGNVCWAGALAHAVFGQAQEWSYVDETLNRLVDYCWDALPAEYGVPYTELSYPRIGQLVQWNNLDATQEQVVGLLDEAARLAKEVENLG